MAFCGSHGICDGPGVGFQAFWPGIGGLLRNLAYLLVPSGRGLPRPSSSCSGTRKPQSSGAQAFFHEGNSFLVIDRLVRHCGRRLLEHQKLDIPWQPDVARKDFNCRACTFSSRPDNGKPDLKREISSCKTLVSGRARYEGAALAQECQRLSQLVWRLGLFVVVGGLAGDCLCPVAPDEAVVERSPK